MSRIVTITSVTANTPVDIYYCDAMSASCVFVSTVATFPYIFEVPSPYDTEDIVIKITDTQGCIDGDIIYITPTPTPSITPSPTLTPSTSVTPTLSPTQTPSFTPTSTQTPTVTPTITSTPTATPLVSFHASSNSCQSAPNITGYYTYISESNLTPVVGATVYQNVVNGVLYNPFNGGGNLYVLSFGGNPYQVRINSQGVITEFSLCFTPSQTPTNTQTPSITPSQTTTNTQTPTNTQTISITPSQTPTTTQTPTPTTTQTPTNTLTPTTTQTPSGSGSVCTGYTIYSEWSVSSALAGFFKIPSTGVTYLNDTQYTVFSGTATYHTNPSSDVVGGGGVSAQVAKVILNCPTTIDAISTGGEVIQASVSKTITCNVYRNGVLVDTKTEVVGPFLFPVTYQFTAMDIGGVISANDVFRFEFL